MVVSERPACEPVACEPAVSEWLPPGHCRRVDCLRAGCGRISRIEPSVNEDRPANDETATEKPTTADYTDEPQMGRLALTVAE